MQPGAGGVPWPGLLASTKSAYAVMFVAHHRWLGPVWPADLQFRLVLAPHPTQEKTRHKAQGPLSDIDIQIDGRTFRLITGAKMFGPLWCPCVT